MVTDVIFTLTGTDRPGIVEEVTRVFLELGANVGTSRMTRLGGEFVILMLVSVPTTSLSGLEDAFDDLIAEGYRVTAAQALPVADTEYEGWVAYDVAVAGADHEGIVHEVAREIASAGATIDEMETDIVSAPVSGTPLFTMSALVRVPPTIEQTEWLTVLDDAARKLDVDLTVERRS